MSRFIESEGRWIRALLILATLTVGLVFIGLAANVVLYFSEIILILVMAWVFAFVLSPVVTAIKRVLPAAPRSVVVVTVYALLFVVLSAIVLVIASQLADSIVSFTEELPTLRERMPEILGEWQDRLDALGLQVNLVLVANDALDGVAESSGQFLGPLQQIALASLNTLGNLMFMVFLSLFIVIDKDRLLGFVNQVTPPRFAEEMRLFQTSVASSFGGFIRGQGIQGLVFGAVAAAGSIALGIEFVPLTTALVAIFQMIPFFGPFISWAPPVVAAILTQPDAIIPILIIMAVGWFVTMNIVQPRVMASSVGIHPIVVLVSVLIGLRLQGVVGAIFAIPVAAVISAFFFHYLNRSKGGPRDVTSRAARRLEARQGRP
ncbi:MAG TPA: AI-2E family transporter, partial [Candidatus Deferrimicrobium sp.]|nr:AI-2E family transporter [Candidatus Deferrimicrobium sp.]